MKAQDIINEIEDEDIESKFSKKPKVHRLNKNLRYFLWTIIGVILIAGLVFATTTITDLEIISPIGTYTNITTDRINVNYFSTGYDVMLSKDNNENVFAINKNGDLIAGGKDNLNVVNAKDFGQVLEYSVNNAPTENVAVFLSSSNTTDSDSKASYYFLNSTVILNKTISLFSVGRNKANIYVGEGVAGGIAVQFNGSEAEVSKWIFRLNNVKFESNRSDNSKQPATFLRLDNAFEVLFTNVEFRDAQDFGVEIRNPDSWSYMTNCWFLDGAFVYIEDAKNYIFLGNNFKGVNITINNSENIIRRGNHFENSFWNFVNTSFSYPDEEFGAVNVNGTLTIGDGSSQYNITMTSSDGTEFTCGVNNSGSLECN